MRLQQHAKDKPQRGSEELLTVQQVAQRLNISRSMLYRLISTGKGPPIVHLGRASRISIIDLWKWVDELERDE